MIEYKLLEALVGVIEEGGFEKAAKKLFLTQSAVSQRIKLLEEQFEQVLLIRSTPPEATPAGVQLITHFKQVRYLEQELLSELQPQKKNEFTSLSIGINEDSLGFWFMESMAEFLDSHKIVLDLHVDDQEETHFLFKTGKVQAYIGTLAKAQHGAQVRYLGSMQYHLVCSPDFQERWFKKGVGYDSLQFAPAVIFNRKDRLHATLLKQILKEPPENYPVFYIPSLEKFADIILRGQAYGMIPIQQSKELVKENKLVYLTPDHHVSIDLYWHSWNLQSKLIKQFGEELLNQGKKALN